MDSKNPIAEVTFADLAKFSEINEQMIREVFLNFKLFTAGEMYEEIPKEFIGKILAKMKTSLGSIAHLRQFQPTYFIHRLAQELLRASEEVKREESLKFGNYDVELDIKNTRDSIERKIAAEYKTEIILWELLKNQQYDQALTIISALEMERAGKDVFYRMEVLNWKIEVLAKTGNEGEFFETSQRMLELGVEGKQLKYDGTMAKGLLLFLLVKKFPKGIPFELNSLGRVKISSDALFGQKIGAEFQDLLTDKIVHAIFTTREINSAKVFNEFLNREWANIVTSFKLINRYVENVKKPYGL